MELRFGHPFQSISAFQKMQLPRFSIITGKNGSGKTHLLQAINQNHIFLDGVQTNGRQLITRYYDWGTLVPQSSGQVSSDLSFGEINSTYTYFSDLRRDRALSGPVYDFYESNLILLDHLKTPFDIFEIDLSKLEFSKNTSSTKESFFESIKKIEIEVSNNILSRFDSLNRLYIEKVSRAASKSILTLDLNDFTSSNIPKFIQSDLFSQNIDRVFVVYRDAFLRNQLLELRKNAGDANLKFLDYEEFLEINGPPPWDLVNECLSHANLDFKVASPSLIDFSPYELKMVKKSTGAEVHPSGLSSGEKIVMSLALCPFATIDSRKSAETPHVLLFDEIDAPLHPSMTKSILKLILDFLVEKMGINVIFTTHSPTTIALSPDDSVFLMESQPTRIKKISKSRALNILMDDVPTLALNFSNRRQIIVESQNDAELFDKIFSIIKPNLDSDRSLEFISLGSASGGGCDRVKKLIKQIVSSGNMSIFGLIDHDGKNNPDSRIFILGDGERDGLENFILDPLSLAFLICRDLPSIRGSVGISNSENYVKFFDSNESHFQNIVNNIQLKIFGNQPDETFEVEYLSGMRLSLDLRWSSTDDHQLENFVLQAFPAMRGRFLLKNNGNLKKYIVNTILTENRDIIPMSLYRTFESLLRASPH